METGIKLSFPEASDPERAAGAGWACCGEGTGSARQELPPPLCAGGRIDSCHLILQATMSHEEHNTSAGCSPLASQKSVPWLTVLH